MSSKVQTSLKRSGLRLHAARGHSVVRQTLKRFAVWLRTRFEFPIRVPVYLLSRRYVITQFGQRVSASFFAPWSRDVEPYIRIATGDYSELRRARGRDHALASFVFSFAHEVIHYQQWLATGRVSERGVVRKAQSILRDYCQTVDHP